MTIHEFKQPEPERKAYIKRIPEGVLGAIDRYVSHGIEPGSFTRAVLENNLIGAINRADVESMAALKDIVEYVYWDLPSGCWGSKEKVSEWMIAKRNKQL